MGSNYGKMEWIMEEKKEDFYTFISGATGGIGRAFAFACAKEGNVFLTGRSLEKLAKLKDEILKKYPASKVEIYPCFLTEESSRAELFEYIVVKGLKFSRLCNVAGADIQKSFEKYTQEKIIFQCRVNLEATLCLTRFILSNRAPELEIVTIGSISGVYPMPYFAIYSATKNALSWFFSALRLELRGQGVKITTVQPGGVYTRPDIIKDIAGQGLWGKMSAKTPEYIARKSLKAVKKNKRIYFPGFWNKFIAYVPRVLPLSIRMKFIAARWRKLEKDAFPICTEKQLSEVLVGNTENHGQDLR